MRLVTVLIKSSNFHEYISYCDMLPLKFNNSLHINSKHHMIDCINEFDKIFCLLAEIDYFKLQLLFQFPKLIKLLLTM